MGCGDKAWALMITLQARNWSRLPTSAPISIVFLSLPTWGFSFSYIFYSGRFGSFLSVTSILPWEQGTHSLIFRGTHVFFSTQGVWSWTKVLSCSRAGNFPKAGKPDSLPDLHFCHLSRTIVCFHWQAKCFLTAFKTAALPSRLHNPVDFITHQWFSFLDAEDSFCVSFEILKS